MKNKLKDNLLFYTSLLILIIWSIAVVIKQSNYFQSVIENNKEYLLSCKEGCMEVFTKPLDTITLFFNNIGNTSFHLLGFCAPLFVIVPTVYYFFRKIKSIDIKNVLVRESYHKMFLKEYLKALRSTFIIPIFLVILFILTYFQSGNFDIDYTFLHGGASYVFAGEENIRNYLTFIPVYFLVLWLHSIFWANIGILSVKKNKSVAVSSIIAFVIYFLIFIVMEVFVGMIVSNESVIYPYLGFGNIWLHYNVTSFGMIITGFLLVIISTILVLLSYKNKEKIILECERR